jgi:hypothetical protein
MVQISSMSCTCLYLLCVVMLTAVIAADILPAAALLAAAAVTSSERYSNVTLDASQHSRGCTLTAPKGLSVLHVKLYN